MQVPLVILGDLAYPGLPWLMNPYPENAHTTANQRHFNYRQSRARMVVESAFGRLKGRWRCLLKRLDVKLDNVTNIVAACGVFHNMCEFYGDVWPTELADTLVTQITPHLSTTTETDSARIRDAIVQHLQPQ